MATTAPEFIERNAQAIIDRITATYQGLTGKILRPAQPEALFIQAVAYEILLLREGVQSAALQNLVDFSSAPVLDYLGASLGVQRLPASPATVNITFTLTTHNGVVIPAGTRVRSTDGRVVFATIAQKDVNSGVTTVDVEAECVTAGVTGNGYIAGTIDTILDPQAYTTSAANASTTEGGAEDETDENLRVRIKLAPDAFSVAGSTGAYRYWARTASQRIIDVEILDANATGLAGVVEVYPLMDDGSVTPSQIITAVETILDADKIRPINDTVNVYAPTRTTYALVADITIYETAVSSIVQSNAEKALNAFVTEKRKKLGQDVKLNKLRSVAMVEGAYDVDFGAFTDIIVALNEFAFCTGVTVNIVGTNVG